ncbi:DUF1178 family protein [Palleronia pelagia]|uniref:DUF1178 family protein n=1 Tax=Palleronia pelagia TaxID=387096 RepID=A0A1H8IHS8_9RHOB|nr:DUF1178 family protein [Palleronia pelagia]SEN67417.1 hypothetical protein SAMN04488011_105218 [Palleronia pelagia]
MIRFSLSCADGHDFESWFASNVAFDRLAQSGRVTCPDCGSAHVKKALMAPRVRSGGAPVAADAPPPKATDDTHPLARLRRKIESEAKDVGRDFARQARAMHEGAAPHQPIYGQAELKEARALVEDGVPIAPLPFIPKSKTN